jgi:UDP-glucose 4-epimerase
VTGGAGKLGHRLCRRLVELGVGPVRVVDSRRDEPLPGITMFAGGIADAALLDAAFSGLETVVHLAGLADAAESSRQPLEYFDVNVGGTAAVMDAARRQQVKRVVFASSAYVYGAPDFTPVTEEHPLRPCSVYATSKAAAEHVVAGCTRANGGSAAIARFSNLYGAPFGASTVVGRLLHAAVAGLPLTVRSTTPVRDFLHVDDAVAALIALAAADVPESSAEIVNVSTGIGTSVGQLTALVAEVSTADGCAVSTSLPADPPRAEPTPELVLSPGRMRALTAWSPALDLRGGVRQSLHELKQIAAGGRA